MTGEWQPINDIGSVRDEDCYIVMICFRYEIKYSWLMVSSNDVNEDGLFKMIKKREYTHFALLPKKPSNSGFLLPIYEEKELG